MQIICQGCSKIETEDFLGHKIKNKILMKAKTVQGLTNISFEKGIDDFVTIEAECPNCKNRVIVKI